jgi:CDP-diacylglycerol--serine O-phosphatidyltransferase
MGKFRFRKRKHKPHAEREIPLRTMIPNLVTLMAAASGITSIRYSCQGHWDHAVVAIFIACVLDGVDGRVARMLRATSKLGAELDSLSDFVSFGVAPALFIYFWIMQKVPLESAAYPFRGVFWALALFYAMCGAFRLARFNIMIDDGPTQPYWKHFFLGLPAPGGAGLVLTPAIWQLHTESDLFQTPWIGGAVLVICGVLMASRVPTISAKSVRVPAKYMVPFLLFIMFVISMLVSQFWLTLGVIGVTYYTSIPIVGFIFLRMRKRHDARNPEPPPAPASPAAAAVQ